MKKSNFLSMKLVMLLVALIPLVSGLTISGISSITSLEKELITQTEERLLITTSMISEYFGCDWTEWMAGGEILESDEAFVDSCLSEDIEITVFDDNIRYLSSIRNSDGSRVSGTKADDSIYAKVKAGETYIGENVVINGKPYMVCYKPIYNEDKEFVGMAFAGTLESKIKDATSSLVKQQVILLAVVIAIFAAIVIYVTRLIVTPLTAVVKSLTELSNGQINEKIEAKTHVNETINIIDSTKKLQGSLQTIVGNLRNASSSLTSGADITNELCLASADNSTNISSAIEDVAQGSTQLAQEVEQLATQMENISQNVLSITDITSQLVSISEGMKEVSNQAQSDIISVYNMSESNAKESSVITANMNELKASIAEINAAVELITSIASQTNLLALNASIEAARAGEAGKGFAVVADEIKNLSDQSNDGAKEIRTIVEGIVSLSTRSISLISNISESITQEQSKVEATRDSFDHLKENIENSIVAINEISEQVKTLDNAKNICIDSISDLSAVSEENSASSQEIAANTQVLSGDIDTIKGKSTDIKGYVDVLNGVVNSFK